MHSLKKASHFYSTQHVALPTKQTSYYPDLIVTIFCHLYAIYSRWLCLDYGIYLSGCLIHMMVIHQWQLFVNV